MLRVLQFVDSINKWVGNIICYLVVVIMLTGVYEVVMRYFFNRPTIWVWEINGFLLCIFIALGGGYTLLVRGHVRVDIVYDFFSTRVKAIMDLITSFFIFLFLGILLWQGVEQGLLSLERLESTHTFFRPPIYPFKIILAIGTFLFLLQAVANFGRYIYIASSGKVVGNGT
ncbi:hypothetical protein ES707_10889 [subsurface metagenome]